MSPSSVCVGGILMSTMDLAWLDKDDNPAMSEWGVESEDVYGTIALINFAELTFKIALTHDFTTWHPIDRIEQLRKVGWLDEQSASAPMPR